MRIFKILSLSLLVLSILYYISIPVREAYTLKEIPNSNSLGNCRIVNTVESIKNGLELRMYSYDSSSDARHIIAVNKDGKIIDKSEIKKNKDGKYAESLDGKELNYYENRLDAPPHLEYIYTSEQENIFVSHSIWVYNMVIYFKIFTLTYKIYH